MENKEIIKKLKDFVEELENEEKLKVPSFADISRDELIEVIELYRAGKIDLKDYWKVGDTKEYNGCTYVIIDIGYDQSADHFKFDKNTVTIMRTDLINLNVSLSDVDGDWGSRTCKELEGTLIGKQMRQFPEFFTGRFFSGLTTHVRKSDFTLVPRIFLPSEEEIFDKEKAYEYFKDIKNRRLGNPWWSCSGFLRSNGYAYFVYCRSDGSQDDSIANNSRGLAPCFVI